MPNTSHTHAYKIYISRGKQIFDDVIGYLRENNKLQFPDWKCVTVLLLPNSQKQDKVQKGHIILTGEYQNNNFLEKLNITKEYEVTDEYEILATTLLACTHSESLWTRRGIPLLSDDKENEELDIDDDNRYSSYVLWSPEQADAIKSKEKRLIFHGTSGGPSQVLMAKAKNVKSHKKKYILLADTSDNLYTDRIKIFCRSNKVQFLDVSDCPWFKNFVVNGDKTKHDEMIQGINEIENNCDQLFIDEIPQVKYI